MDGGIYIPSFADEIKENISNKMEFFKKNFCQLLRVFFK